MSAWWEYEQLESGEPYDWGGAARGDKPWDNVDFHLDIGCGRSKKGRLGIDHHPDEGVDMVMDLETLVVTMDETRGEVGDLYHPTFRYGANDQPFGAIPGRLPFPDESIWSIISHHCLEHIDQGFVRLMDECHRVLIPGGLMRIVVPLFPSASAVSDPDHKRYFMDGTFETFCGNADGSHWMDSFSTPYTNCRFKMVDLDISPLPYLDVGGHRVVDVEKLWSSSYGREMRVGLMKHGSNQ